MLNEIFIILIVWVCSGVIEYLTCVADYIWSISIYSVKHLADIVEICISVLVEVYCSLNTVFNIFNKTNKTIF